VPVYRGTVQVSDGARYELASAAPDEVIRLHEGSITIDIAGLAPGERVRVITDDGEVEGGQGRLIVMARADTLTEVEVERGRFEVRTLRQPPVVLADGQRWPAKVAMRTERVIPPKIVSPPRLANLPMAKLFDAGWQELRAGRPAEAARIFGDALARYPGDALAEDAAFWHGVALRRAQQRPAAVKALTAFLDKHRRSPRVGEASAMLGWLLLEGGDLDGAERRFQAAAKDPVKSVRDSAAKGLTAVATTRKNQER
jgi:tetratricopeptide (TPR) repeat protein